MGDMGHLQRFGKSFNVGVLDNFPLCGASRARYSDLIRY